MINADRPVEIPSTDPNFDLDSFLDSLNPQLRMKVVREISGEAEPPHRGGEASSETALGRSWTWQKVLLAVLVAPVLACLYAVLLAGRLAEILMCALVKFTKEKLDAR